jgi:RNA polymerase sigma-70 factor, ECF subfamily
LSAPGRAKGDAELEESPAGDDGLAALRRVFSERYRMLRVTVARRLGGAGDIADDALHEAYVRLSDKGGLKDVRHPVSYLVNTVVHVAIDRLRSEARTLSETEVESFLEVPDEAPGPAQSAAGRLRLSRLQALMQQLPPRQLDILMALRVHGLPRAELSRRWGISERQVARELAAAQAFCARGLGDEEERDGKGGTDADICGDGDA